MPHRISSLKWRFFFGSLVILSILIAACGGATTSSGNGATTSAGSGSSNQNAVNAPGSSPHQPASPSNKKSLDAPQQYLIKSLNVSLEVKDTRKVASELQAWIAATDPRSTSAGTDYEQVGNNQYSVALTYSVEASMYPQVYACLRDYTLQHSGKLLTFTEKIQDVTNDYIDTQSQLTNLRGEQQRLLQLLSHAQALGDVLSIEQRLTDVEGQIEQIEAHLKDLNGQTSFYNISITLQPSAAATQGNPDGSWNIGSIWQGALSAAAVFGEGLVAVLIWLLVFSVYLLPLALIIWGIVWFRRRRFAPRVAAATPTGTPPTTTP